MYTAISLGEIVLKKLILLILISGVHGDSKDVYNVTKYNYFK